MSSFADSVKALRELPSDAKAGLAFEKLMVNYFTVDPVLSKTYKNVARFNDSPFFSGKPETGIDLVAQRVDDDSWAAIQCKFYRPTTTLAKGNLDSFFEASGHTFDIDGETVEFKQRIIIATTDKWSKNAEEMLNDSPFLSRVSVCQTSPNPSSTGTSLSPAPRSPSTSPADRPLSPDLTRSKPSMNAWPALPPATAAS